MSFVTYHDAVELLLDPRLSLVSDLLHEYRSSPPSTKTMVRWHHTPFLAREKAAGLAYKLGSLAGVDRDSWFGSSSVLPTNLVDIGSDGDIGTWRGWTNEGTWKGIGPESRCADQTSATSPFLLCHKNAMDQTRNVKAARDKSGVSNTVVGYSPSRSRCRLGWSRRHPPEWWFVYG